MISLRSASWFAASVVVAASSVGAAPASAGGPQTWPFDIQTTGTDVFWTSPTAVNPSRPRYDTTFTITQLLVNARLGPLNLGPIDVTNQIPLADRTGSGVGAGPAPATFVNQTFVYPDPPAPVGFSALLTVALDAAGFGKLSMTNVVLGPVTVDLGPPLGVQTVTLTRMHIIGSVTIDPVACPADFDGDGMVGSSDLALLLGAWNTAGPGADLNLDGAVSSADLALLLGSWGICPP